MYDFFFINLSSYLFYMCSIAAFFLISHLWVVSMAIISRSHIPSASSSITPTPPLHPWSKIKTFKIGNYFHNFKLRDFSSALNETCQNVSPWMKSNEILIWGKRWSTHTSCFFSFFFFHALLRVSLLLRYLHYLVTKNDLFVKDRRFVF